MPRAKGPLKHDILPTREVPSDASPRCAAMLLASVCRAPTVSPSTSNAGSLLPNGTRRLPSKKTQTGTPAGCLFKTGLTLPVTAKTAAASSSPRPLPPKPSHVPILSHRPPCRCLSYLLGTASTTLPQVACPLPLSRRNTKNNSRFTTQHGANT
jgi:hypothetical protein